MGNIESAGGGEQQQKEAWQNVMMMMMMTTELRFVTTVATGGRVKFVPAV